MVVEDFLTIQSRLMYDTLNSYLSLLKSENFLQALILFRSYIEYSSQFYACLLDYEFFQKYTQSEIVEEEYKKRFMSGFVSDYFKNSYKDLVTFFANEKKRKK